MLPSCGDRWSRRAQLRTLTGDQKSVETRARPPLSSFGGNSAPARPLEGSPMSPNAKAFIALVLGTGAAVLANGLVHSSWPDMGRFLCYLLAVTVASGFKIVLPGISGTMSVNLMVILISVIELSPGETLVLGCVASVVQTLWHNKHIQAIHVAFNAAQIAISIELSYFVFHHSAPLLGEQVPLRLMATAITYFLANTVPVAVVISLTEHHAFSHTWAEYYFWSFPHYLVGCLL